MLIDQNFPDWLITVQTLIADTDATASQGNTWYALVDTAFVPSCFALLQKRKNVLTVRYLFDLSAQPRTDLAAVSPVLFALTPPAMEHWRDILQQADRWPMLTLIATTESLDELSERLAPWCVVNADGQDFVLRFADTRRLPDIVGVLTEAQHGELFGPARAVTIRTRAAHWVALPLPEKARARPVEVHFSAEQFGELVAASEADEILVQFNRNSPTLTAHLLPSQAHAQIESALATASAFGIDGPDRSSWCRILLQHPGLHTLPASVALLHRYRNDKFPYIELEDQMIAVAEAAH